MYTITIKRKRAHFYHNGDCMNCKRFHLLCTILISLLWATPDFGFEEDTIITCGQKEVPVKIEYLSGQQGDTSTVIDDTIYIDSIGRVVKRGYHSEKPSLTQSQDLQSTTFIGMNNDIIIRYTSMSHQSSEYHSETKDTLIGEAWNEQGEILEGRIYRVKTYFEDTGDKVYADTFHVTIAYDEKGVKPVDTTTIDSSGFVPDTIMTFGVLDIPVRHYLETKSGSTESEYFNLYRDSLGRWLSGEYEYDNSSGSYGHRETRQCFFNQEGKIATRYSYFFMRGMKNRSHKYDTLQGENWNELGMITKGSVSCSSSTTVNGMVHGGKGQYDILYAYDSSGLIVKDSFKIRDGEFQADTLVDLQVPYEFYPVKCEFIHEIDSVDSTGKAIEESRKTYLRDSLSRVIKAEFNRKTKYSGSNITYWVSFDENDRIDTTFTKEASGTVVSSSAGYDTLFAHSWNEKGMIIKGVLHSKRTTSFQGQASTHDTAYVVEITYDSTGVVAIDTVTSEITSVISTQTLQNKTLSVKQQDNSLVIKGLLKNERVVLFDVKGRVLFQGVASSTGLLAIPKSNYAQGIGLLKTEKRVVQVRF